MGKPHNSLWYLASVIHKEDSGRNKQIALRDMTHGSKMIQMFLQSKGLRDKGNFNWFLRIEKRRLLPEAVRRDRVTCWGRRMRVNFFFPRPGDLNENQTSIWPLSLLQDFLWSFSFKYVECFFKAVIWSSRLFLHGRETVGCEDTSKQKRDGAWNRCWWSRLTRRELEVVSSVLLLTVVLHVW